LNVWREHIIEKLSTPCHIDPRLKKKKRKWGPRKRNFSVAVAAAAALLLKLGTVKYL